MSARIETRLVLRCDLCGEEMFAASPGSEPVRELFVLGAGEPMRCWCMRHWLEAHGAMQGATAS